MSSPEVDGAAVVGVECSEDVVAEVVRAAAGEDLGVHLHKLVLGQLAAGTVCQEPLVPLLHTQVSSVSSMPSMPGLPCATSQT